MVELNNLKKHLNIDLDYDDDNEYLLGLIEVSEQIIQQHINNTFEQLIELYGKVPAPIDHATLLLCGHYYANREIAIIGANISKLPLSFEYLIQPYINYK